MSEFIHFDRARRAFEEASTIDEAGGAGSKNLEASTAQDQSEYARWWGR
ncbi:MAG: hypothetical protein GY722_29245 [bacterium]|nr:hypothetical protein [bacterium]